MLIGVEWFNGGFQALSPLQTPGLCLFARQALMSMDLLNKVATTALLGFVVSSMMAMGVGFTVGQIAEALRDVRLVQPRPLEEFLAVFKDKYR